MESYTLSQFPAPYSTVHLALFRNLRNASTIRTRLIEAAQMGGPEGEAARKKVEFGFVDAAYLASKEHLMTAILTTLLLALPAGSDDPTPRTRSHNLHSEILLTLHTNNIISEAIKKFGISNTTTSLLVVRFGDGEQEDVWNAMDEVVEGELVPLSTLDGAELVDWKALVKIYKLSELNRLPLSQPEIVEKKIAAVINTVAVKSVT